MEDNLKELREELNSISPFWNFSVEHRYPDGDTVRIVGYGFGDSLMLGPLNIPADTDFKALVRAIAEESKLWEEDNE